MSTDRRRIRALALTVILSAALAVACGPTRSGPGSGGPETPSFAPDPAGFAGVTGRPDAGASPGFWEHWGDGRAELTSYRATVSRYGDAREAELVLIYVTEPHDRRTWIKDDDVAEPHRTEVLKLNASWKFLTGIYPYSVMTSVFSPVADWGGERFRPVKIAHSVQEWCGTYAHSVWPGLEAMRSLRVSYFSGEGERLETRGIPDGTLYEDALLVQLRELDGPFAGGGDWEGRIVPSLWNVRRGIAPAEPLSATITRERVTDDDGTPRTRFTLRYRDYTRTYDVEVEPPHRVVGWTTSTGDTVRMVESRRLPYWRLNAPEGRRHRAELGLDPDASGRPPESPEP